MILPPLTFAVVRRLPTAAAVAEGMEHHYLGRAVVLPAELPEAERADVVDLFALFLDLPVHVAARAGEGPTGHIVVLTEPVDAEPPSIPGSILLCAARHASGRRRLDAPRDLLLLRDAIVECLGRHHSGTRLQRVAAWSGWVSDAPGLALRCASASTARHLADPQATDTEILSAGLAAAVGHLLRGLDWRVAQWALARALPARHPERLVDTEAAILGEDAALQRAFAAGLVVSLPDEPGDPLDLRRPLELLGDDKKRPPDVGFGALAKELRAVLAPEVYVVIERMLASAPKPLGLTGPDRPKDFVGRAEVLKRLRSLFEPAETVSTVVLYGVLGSGRTAVAAAFCELMAGTLEPVWLTFAGGPSSGWVPVANALGVEIKETEGSPAPRWVKRVHDLLRDRRCLVVVSDVEDVPEAELPAWLPSGPGECAVLVLSAGAQRMLQRESDAIAVPLRALSLEESKELLAGKVPKMADEIRRGEADGLLRVVDGHSGALGMAAGLLEKMSLAEVEALAKHRDGPIRALVQKAVEALDAEETRLAKALAVCAPEGSLPALPLGMVGVGEGVLRRLEDRALVVTRKGRVRLHGLIRLAMERETGEEERERLEVAHGKRAVELFEAAQKARDAEAEDGAYDDALLGLTRMTGRCQPGAEGVADVVVRLAEALLDYPRGNAEERIGRVIAGCKAALTVYDEARAPEPWSGTQNLLGLALWSLPVGDRAESLQQAIDAFRAALTVWTKEANPEGWSWAQNNLGIAFNELPVGDKAENQRQAIDAYRAALTVRTRETYPSTWAATQNNLGNALAALPTGDRAENLRQAIDAYRAALTVHTKDAYSEDWAMAQNNLGAALADLPTGDRAENLRQAIDAYRAALTVYTRETHPGDWAMAQNNLGIALKRLPTGDTAENLKQAIDAYRAALTVRTKEAFPWDWALTQHNLGVTFQELPSGDRNQNLRDAIEAFRAALTVYTPESWPDEHARAQIALDLALHDLAALDTPPPPPEAPHPRPRRPAPPKRPAQRKRK